VVVVTGANADQVESAIHDLSLTIPCNENWQDGQSTSIKTGLHTLPIETGAAIFLLADQPQITPAVLRALIEEHARTLAPIIAPLVNGQRANPVLFDRLTFPDLMALSGDVGGRAVFSRHTITYLPWYDTDLLGDVDTPEEYRKLVNGE
jgi:molybdenum cofactor cytidylyltransferase